MTRGYGNGRSAIIMLALLFCSDFAFIALHVINSLWVHNPMLSIDFDWGYAEFYGYIKLFWICLLLIYIQSKYSCKQYLAWVLVFSYFLLDDSLRLHEIAGNAIAENLSFHSHLSVIPGDFGQLAFFAFMGLVLLLPLAWAYKSGSTAFRKVSQDIILLIFILVFCGVIVDFIHSIKNFSREIRYILGIIEDGGEMVTISLILWYIFSLATRRTEAEFYLCDTLRNWFAKRQQPSTSSNI